MQARVTDGRIPPGGPVCKIFDRVPEEVGVPDRQEEPDIGDASGSPDEPGTSAGRVATGADPMPDPGTAPEAARAEQRDVFGGFLPPRPVPRPVVRADLLPALSTTSLIALLGVPLGWIWSRLAPPERSTLAPGGTTTSLVESYHEFDALALFLLLSAVFGLLTGAVLWLVRRRRGPVLLLGGAVGSLLAAWLGAQMGESFAASLHSPPPEPALGQLIALAPEVGTGWAVVVQPLTCALAYGLAAAWNGFDDLGRRS